MAIPLAKPDITELEIGYVNRVLRSDILSIGPVIQEFEAAVADFVGTKYAIAVNSGTSALHLLIRAFNIKDGDEVITTPFSFVASTNCILFERAKPVFADIDSETFNIDINQIEAKITPKTRAILPVDVFGQPCDNPKINEIAKRHNLIVIHDTCESLGSEWTGVKTGSQADAATFAFYPNKQITTGEGGIIVTNNYEVAELSRSMRSQGRPITGTWLNHERLGYNYRLSELHAALGLAQMQRIDEILGKRQAVADLYYRHLSGMPGIILPIVRPEVSLMSWFVYVILVEPGVDRNKVMDSLHQNGVGCKPYFTPIHLQSYIMEMLGSKPGDYPVTEDISSRSIAIPFYANLTEAEIQQVARHLEQAVSQGRP